MADGDGNFIPIQVTAELLPCVSCAAPYLIINGVPQGPLEFRRNARGDSTITVTPHHVGCTFLRSVTDA